MTPLQQAARNIILRWDSPKWKDQAHTAEYLNALRVALEAEQAQAVGPVALHGFKASHAESGSVFLEPTSIQIGRAQQAQAVEPVAWMHPSRDPHLVSHSAYTYGSASVPLYTHPAPPPAQQGLSLDLLERLSKTLTNLGYSTPEGGMEHFGAQIESQLYNLCRGVDSILAQQVVVPTGWALVPIEPTPAILDAMSSSGWKTACYKAMLAAAQGVKLVTKKDSKTDWSAA